MPRLGSLPERLRASACRQVSCDNGRDVVRIYGFPDHRLRVRDLIDVRAGDDAPKTMPQDQTLPNNARNDSPPLMPMLITPDGKKQFSTRIPKLPRRFASPVGDLRANQRRVVGVIVYEIHLLTGSALLVSVSSHP